MPFEPSSAPIARTRLAARLIALRASNRTIDDALIVLSELVTNAICHGVPRRDGTFEVSWSVADGQLLISVSDAGAATSLEPVDFDQDSLGGRGLSIINRVADRWWVDGAGGTRVNAQLSYA